MQEEIELEECERECPWCYGQGSPDGEGEMHPCCWCGSEG